MTDTKSVIVTGGGAGLGRVTAIAFAETVAAVAAIETSPS